MGDSVFHIVKRDDGQFHLVQLERIKMNTNSKQRGATSSECDSNKTSNKIDGIEAPRISAFRNYSRVRTKNADTKSILIDTKKTTTITTENEQRLFNEVPAGVATKTGKVNSVDRSGEHASTIVLRKVPRKSINSKSEKSAISARPSLLNLAAENIKCNVCGLTFSKSDDQLKILRSHFLQHKTSLIKITTGAKHQSNELHDKISRSNQIKSTKDPIILNNAMILNSDLRKNVKTFMTLTESGGKKVGHSQFEIDTIGKSSSNLSRRKIIKVTHISSSLLEQLRSAQSEKDIGISTMLNGNMPSPQANMIQCSDGETITADPLDEGMFSDGDDDVEIVEREPEVIVIDDNGDDQLP